MRSLAFPKMFNHNKTLVIKDLDATKSNLNLLLKSKLGEFFGDPEYGSILVNELYQFDSVILEDILKDKIYTLITFYLPQINLKRENIIISNQLNTLEVSITATNDLTKDLEKYDFSLQK